MKTNFTWGMLVVGLVLSAIFGASPVAAQGQPGVAPGAPGIEPPRLQPVPPKIPPDFQEPPGQKEARPRKVFDPVKARQQAHELAFLANQIPDEMEMVRNSVLPTDLIKKLKRIEKLSKQLRSQVAP